MCPVVDALLHGGLMEEQTRAGRETDVHEENERFLRL